MKTSFSQKAKENLRFYVYALVNPLNGRIFYIGKGENDRVFQHVACALETSSKSDKLDTIRQIQSQGKEVKYYILRHGLDEDDAYTLESMMIDFLTYPAFSKCADIANLTNEVSGHHQFDKGVKTAEEIEILYDCKSLEEKNIIHNVMTINVNKTYNINNVRHPNLYEATRKSWKVSALKIQQVEYVLSEYKGVIRGIFKPERWYEETPGRWAFEGIEITKENNPEVYDRYMNKQVPKKPQGCANPIRYYWK